MSSFIALNNHLKLFYILNRSFTSASSASPSGTFMEVVKEVAEQGSGALLSELIRRFTVIRAHLICTEDIYSLVG
ncbi:hypothetical protein O6P43_027752 [Quillaja saponaria]|uniref:Uncharacterized protein n=1 Tax=Quillaja saponaria TaxID=32244 RepID=A0AAD7L537_QUISA|nr:hypothetical protein O6P43_027752 [Quillaja saponaria]